MRLKRNISLQLNAILAKDCVYIQIMCVKTPSSMHFDAMKICFCNRTGHKASV